MNRLAFVALVAAQIAQLSQAKAADFIAEYEVMPPGSVSCASWTLGRDEAGRGYVVLLSEEGVLRAEREGWVAGYISALNVEILPSDRGVPRDLTAGVARDEIMTAIDDYCAENPLHSLLSATASVGLELTNVWLASHPAGAASGGEIARLPTAGLAPAEESNPVVEDDFPPETTPPPEPPAASLSQPAPLPPPVPAVAAPAPPPAPDPAPNDIPAVAAAPPAPATPTPAAAPEPASAPPPALRGAVSALSGGAILQIGAYRSSAVATEAWQDFLVEYRDVVGDLVSDIQEADLGASGVWHRLRIGPFADRDAANAMCATLKTQGADCFVVVP